MIFVTATDTGVGKTFFSQKIIEAVAQIIDRRDIAYYKPIQCGKDAKELFGNIFYEADYQCIERACPDIDTYCTYEFDFPASPDYASSLENVVIDINKIVQDFEKLKQDYKFIVVEGAGGLAVPINSTEMISDVAKALNLATVLITKPVLGTINQTLLSIEHAKAKGLNIQALILAEGNVAKRTSSRLRRTNDRSVLLVHEDHEDDENAEIGVSQQYPEEDSVSEAMEAAQLEASLESIERFSGIEFRTVAEVVQSSMAKRI
jgi:dethiobiotin synthetase